MSLEARKELIDELRMYVHDDEESCDIKNCPIHCSIKHRLDLDTSLAWDVVHFLKEPRSAPVHERDEENLKTLRIVVGAHADRYTQLFRLVEQADEMGRPDKSLDY